MVNVLLNGIYEFLFQGAWVVGKVVKVERDPYQVSFVMTRDGINRTINCHTPTAENVRMNSKSAKGIDKVPDVTGTTTDIIKTTDPKPVKAPAGTAAPKAPKAPTAPKAPQASAGNPKKK